MVSRIRNKVATDAAKALSSKKPAASPRLASKPKKTAATTPKNTIGTKRKREDDIKSESGEESSEELPYNMGKVPKVKHDEEASSPIPAATPKKAPASKTSSPKKGSAKKSTPKKGSASKRSASPKTKTMMYKLSPGQSPFPDWEAPTIEQCIEVDDILSKLHGKHQAPKAIPPPSTTVSGCGEVPSVLDALIRTLLSAATTGTNSSRAFQGIVKEYGLIKEGIGKGSANWEEVRVSSTKRLFEAIKCGGLGDSKSKNIKRILDMVHEEQQEKLTDSSNSKSKRKAKDIVKASVKQNILSLDHLHALPDEEVIEELLKFPGIGPKTASCVSLFCLRRPSFAVDTHVFRLSEWLGWIPPTATRNTAYSHLEVRIPNDLKYSLHQLFIKHGKTCPRCRASTGETSKNWGDGCVIEELVQRSGARKEPKAASPKKSKTEPTPKEEETEAAAALEETKANVVKAKKPKAKAKAT